MRYEVAEKTLLDCTECAHGYQCLSDGLGHVCAVTRQIEGDGVIVETQRRVDCPYASECDEGIRCTCPTRIELYERFGL